VAGILQFETTSWIHLLIRSGYSCRKSSAQDQWRGSNSYMCSKWKTHVSILEEYNR